jgi:hypothetical protein
VGGVVATMRRRSCAVDGGCPVLSRGGAVFGQVTSPARATRTAASSRRRRLHLRARRSNRDPARPRVVYTGFQWRGRSSGEATAFRSPASALTGGETLSVESRLAAGPRPLVHRRVQRVWHRREAVSAWRRPGRARHRPSR